MSNKALTTVFLVLFIVLVGEIGYLFFSTSSKKSLDNLPEPSVAAEQIAPSLSPERDGVQAISDDILNVLSHANKGVTVSSVLKNQYQGEITELVTQDGLKITIKAENGATNTVHFFKKELEKISFSKEGLILNDLKVKDKIMIEMTINLLEEDLTNNLIESKISVN